MIDDFIYSHPTWLWGTLLVGLAVVGAEVGLLIVHRYVDVELRRRHNELAGFVVAVISVTYAVLLAFIAIAVWESYSAVQETVENEATLVGNMYRDTRGLPPELATPIQGEVRRYIDTVVNEEWPTQEAGHVPEAAWQPLHRLHATVAGMQPQHEGEAVVEAELLRTINQVYLAREARTAAAEGHLPNVIWAIILIGGAFTTAFTYLFGFHDFRLHVVMTGAVAATLALIVVLIVAMDWPLRGEVSISSAAFTRIEAGLGDIAVAQK